MHPSLPLVTKGRWHGVAVTEGMRRCTFCRTTGWCSANLQRSDPFSRLRRQLPLATKGSLCAVQTYNSSKRTTLLLIRQPSAATFPSRGRLWMVRTAPRLAPREIPRRGRNPFLVVQGIAKGRFRPHKLHIPRPAASGRSRSLRCSSSPNCVRSAGTQFGSFSLAVFLYTASGAFFRHAKEGGAEPPR